MSYDLLRFLHLTGVVLLVGNVTVSSIWKLYADATRDPAIIAFGQRLVTITDWFFTFWGIVLLILGGYGAAWVGRMDVLREGWLVWSEAMFGLAGVIWLGLLVPIQITQSRMARGFVRGEPVPEAYFRLGRRWIIFGSIATVPLMAAMWLMLRRGW